MKYRVYGMVTISCWTYVEADSPEQAKEIADERNMTTLCHQPFSSDGTEDWIIDELDGIPEIEGVEED